MKDMQESIILIIKEMQNEAGYYFPSIILLSNIQW